MLSEIRAFFNCSSKVFNCNTFKRIMKEPLKLPYNILEPTLVSIKRRFLTAVPQPQKLFETLHKTKKKNNQFHCTIDYANFNIIPCFLQHSLLTLWQHENVVETFRNLRSKQCKVGIKKPPCWRTIRESSSRGTFPLLFSVITTQPKIRMGHICFLTSLSCIYPS